MHRKRLYVEFARKILICCFRAVALQLEKLIPVLYHMELWRHLTNMIELMLPNIGGALC